MNHAPRTKNRKLLLLASLVSLTALHAAPPDLSKISSCAHLKTLTLVRYGKGYPDETQAKVKALLSKVDVKFVK